MDDLALKVAGQPKDDLVLKAAARPKGDPVPTGDWPMVVVRR